MSEPYVTGRSKGVIVWGCGSVVSLIILLVILFACNSGSANAETSSPNLVAKQHTLDSCVLAAMATSMNYKSGGFNYTSAGMALAYKLKYHREDWGKNGQTSHEAQQLAEDAGFKVQYGKLDSSNGGVEALKYLAWSHQYPVVFLNGSVQHAVVVIDVVNANRDDAIFLVADPLTGNISPVKVAELFNKLEPEKWFVSLK